MRRTLAILAVALLTACTIQANEPTPAATSTDPRIEPTPTPVPQTPAELACHWFSQLVVDAWYATVDAEEAKALPIGHLSSADATGTVRSRLWGLAQYLEENGEVAMARAMRQLAFTTINASENKFVSGTIYGRQMARLCAVRGFTAPTTSPDVLIEYICGGSRLSRPLTLNPALEGVGSRCNDGHSHDSYDDHTHSHRELHSHIGGYSREDKEDSGQ